MSNGTLWISGKRENPHQIRYRLFCFSHAGGSSSLYARWRHAFGPNVEVCPVILPGREIRAYESPYRSMDAVIPVIVENLVPFMDKPFSLFGHSLGSVIAFEVAQKVTKMALPLETLMVSGRRAAHIKAKREPVYKLDDDRFLKEIGRLNGTPKEILENKQIMNNFLTCLRADFELHETYEPFVGKKLDCNLVALMGNADPEVDELELVAWGELTSGNFNHHILPGDHFYLFPVSENILNIVKAGMSVT